MSAQNWSCYSSYYFMLITARVVDNTKVKRDDFVVAVHGADSCS